MGEEGSYLEKKGVMWVSERVVESLYGYKVHSEGTARHVQGDLIHRQGPEVL